MGSEDVKPNPVSNMVGFHEFVLQRHYAPIGDTQGSDKDMDTVLPRYEIEEGENWLRLLQKEGRSILDDTQSTQELQDESQSSTVYPSIVALSNVGMVEAPSLDCFICIDLDGTTVAVKDMRTPGISENESIDFYTSQRRSPLVMSSQLGIFRKKTGCWEILQRRRLRILSPGDRICTSIIENCKPGGLCLEYQSGERSLEAKNDTLSQSLLTQPQDEEDDDTVGDNENGTLIQQSLPSQKLEVLDDDEDDDSDRTVCIEESNPLDSIRAASQPSLALLGTQPDSDEDTDVDESKRKKVDKREEFLSSADATLISSRRGAKLMDKNAGIASKGGNDSDDDTDVGEQNNPVEKGSSASKLGKGLGDQAVYNEESRKSTSTLLSDPIEDSDDETDIEGEKNARIANHFTTKLQHRLGKKEKVQASEKQEATFGVLDGSNTDISSQMKELSYTGLRAVQFSPSLCAETQDPPESNPKFTGQDSAPLSSPIKESMQETTSGNSVSLLSPARGGVEQTTKGTKKESQTSRNRTITQKIPGIEKGERALATLVMKNDREKCRSANKGTLCIKPKYTEESISNQVPSADAISTRTTAQANGISINGKEKEKDKMEVEKRSCRSASVNSGKTQIVTNLDEDERTKNSRSTPSRFPSGNNNEEIIEEQELDTEGTIHTASSTSRSSALVDSDTDDGNSRTHEARRAQKELEQDEHSKNRNGFHKSKHGTPSVLPGQASQQSGTSNSVCEPTKRRKSKRRRSSEISEVEGACGMKLKLPRHNTSSNSPIKFENSNGESLLETFCEEYPAPPTVNGTPRMERDSQTQISPLECNEKREVRKTRKSLTSNSTSINEVTQEETLSARKRRRASRGTVSCLDDEAPIRVLTTGIELTASQKSMIKRVGGVLLQKIEDAQRATHVIAGSKNRSMRRTPKLMIGLCKTNNIVDVEWLIQSSKARQALPSINFQLLHDSQAETQYKFEMRESLRRGSRMRAAGHSLLGGWSVCCCPGVAGNKKKGNMTPPAKEFRLIVEAAGALWAPLLTKVADFSKLIIVVSKVEDEAAKQLSTKKVTEALKNGAISKSTEEIFSSIMQQQFIL